MKNPLTPAGIEPATFRFVAQHLNHCATAVPQYVVGNRKCMGSLHCIHMGLSQVTLSLITAF